MRQWNVDPKVMCDKHLLGEHVEIHMFLGAMRKGINLGRFVTDGLVDTSTLIPRHAELVKEMSRRGMQHNTPVPNIKITQLGKIDSSANLEELARRCMACFKLQAASRKQK